MTPKPTTFTAWVSLSHRMGYSDKRILALWKKATGETVVFKREQGT